MGPQDEDPAFFQFIGRLVSPGRMVAAVIQVMAMTMGLGRGTPKGVAKGQAGTAILAFPGGAIGADMCRGQKNLCPPAGYKTNQPGCLKKIKKWPWPVIRVQACPGAKKAKPMGLALLTALTGDRKPPRASRPPNRLPGAGFGGWPGGNEPKKLGKPGHAVNLRCE
jgi:hypothetical protein